MTMPLYWQVERKTKKFITRPSPGPHKLDSCITIDLMLKEFLGYAKIRKEVKHILNKGKILVDKRHVKDHKFPIGLMDIIDIAELNEYYRIMLDEKGKFKLVKINKEDANYKYCKVIKKTMLKKKKMQINLVDGKNMIVDKDSYNTGDTVVLDLNSKKIKKHLKLENGAIILLTAGKHIGSIGSVEKINETKGMQKATVIFKDENNNNVETLKAYCYVIDSSIKVKDERD